MIEDTLIRVAGELSLATLVVFGSFMIGYRILTTNSRIQEMLLNSLATQTEINARLAQSNERLADLHEAHERNAQTRAAQTHDDIERLTASLNNIPVNINESINRMNDENKVRLDKIEEKQTQLDMNDAAIVRIMHDIKAEITKLEDRIKQHQSVTRAEIATLGVQLTAIVDILNKLSKEGNHGMDQ